MDGRRFHPRLVAEAETLADGRVELRSPGVGLWRGAPAPGSVVTPHASLGELEVLGVLHRLEAPTGVSGMVVALPGPAPLARRPVAHGDVLLVLDPQAAGNVAAAARSEAAREAAEGLVLRSPSSGRFYAQPGPGKPPFVRAGDVITVGQTVCLLEVMKTFNRVAYDAAGGLPERARVARVVPSDGDDLDAGDPLLELEDAATAPRS